MADRPPFFEKLLPRLQELRARSGRPHWIVIDEAHHLLPTPWRPSSATLPQELSGLMLIIVHPDHVAPAVLSLSDTIVTVGEAESLMAILTCECNDDLLTLRLGMFLAAQP